MLSEEGWTLEKLVDLVVRAGTTWTSDLTKMTQLVASQVLLAQSNSILFS
jgi:hypothetical protein